MSDRNSASRSPRIAYSITMLALATAAVIAESPRSPHQRKGKRNVATARHGQEVNFPAASPHHPTFSSPRIAPPQYVDWRDDEWTRLRQQGRRPAQPMNSTIGTVAGGGCSFDIECDDGNPCTLDQCDIEAGEPLGAGSCSNTNLPPGSPGECDDGIFCNGTETCEGETPVCTSSGSPCAGGTSCNEFFDICHAPCMTNDDCNALDLCNDGFVCTGGVCEGGQAACGAGGDCWERYCFGVGCGLCGLPPCNTTADCPAGQCVDGPRCFDGRCCVDQGGGQFSCYFATESECDDFLAGEWYAGDAGRFANGTCSEFDGCPVYSGGIMDQDVTSVLGPASLSPLPVAPFGQTAVRVGDDYTASRGSFIAMTEFRFLGAAIDLPERAIRFEWFDSSGNLVEDFVAEAEVDLRVQPVLLDPPLVIPASGFVVASVATNLTPNARLFWAATDAPEIGTNDANTLWLDAVRDDVDPSIGGPVGNFGTSGTLAFEIVGDDVPAPNGACCDFDMGSCADVPSWTCAELGGNFAGPGNLCASCSPESMTAGGPCRTCSGTSDPCTSDNDCAGTCDPNDDVCRVCSEGSSQNEFLPCTADADCGDGTCDGACTPSSACTMGACCAADGSCEMTTLNDCTGIFGGFGSSCEPNCCAQPTASGSDDCETVTPHIISVPESTEPPVVVTITGDNSSASSLAASPDSCFPPSGNPLTQELGWFEAFTIDDCAFVTIDFCCTNPVKQPAYATLYSDCPCAFPIRPRAATYDELDPPGTGAPFCSDDNPWHRFGPLEAGTYYYPVFSQLQGQLGPYQLHIEVTGCPDARCCVLDEQNEPACMLLNQLECESASGYYQGPPNLPELVDTCEPQACDTGSCCEGPGVCTDDDFYGGLMTKSLCDLLAGNYRGGATCFGGTCSTFTNMSCLVDQDCPAADLCDITEELLLQQPACPVCEIESRTNCQRYQEGQGNWIISERREGELGLYAADDFIPGAPIIDSVCVWGNYFDGGENQQGPTCGNNVIDQFRVRVFEADGAGGMLPGTLVGESTATSARLQVRVPLGFVVGTYYLSYAYQLQLNDPIGGLLTDGTTYWLEVTNESVPVDQNAGDEYCNWYWSTLIEPTNAFSAVGSEAGYELGGARPRDFAFCLGGPTGPVPITPNGGFTGAELERACCACSGDCRVETLEACDDRLADWNLLDASESCKSTPCSGDPPRGDDCLTDAILVEQNDAVVQFENYCSSLDGFDTVIDEFLGEAPMDTDIWYFYRPSETGLLHLSFCESDLFDSLIAIYHDQDDPTTCPCPLDQTIDLQTRFVDQNGAYGADENCNGLLDGSGGHLERTVFAGNCYTVRVGGYASWRGVIEAGRGTLEFSLNEGVGIPPLAVNPNPEGPVGVASVCDDPTGNSHGRICTVCDGGSRDGALCYAAGSTDCPGGTCNVVESGICGSEGTCSRTAPFPAARFITIEVPPDPIEPDTRTAVRIRAIDIPGAPEVNGEVRWLGPPADFFEGDALTPQQGTFRGAALRCRRFFTDWDEEGVLSAFGRFLVPGGRYEVQQIRETCDPLGQIEDCFSAPLHVRLAEMGDVVAPFGGVTHLDQPDINDIIAVVDKFLGSPAALTKPRVMQVPAELSINEKVDIRSIIAAVDGFLGTPYSSADLPEPGACP